MIILVYSYLLIYPIRAYFSRESKICSNSQLNSDKKLKKSNSPRYFEISSIPNYTLILLKIVYLNFDIRTSNLVLINNSCAFIYFIRNIVNLKNVSFVTSCKLKSKAAIKLGICEASIFNEKPNIKFDVVLQTRGKRNPVPNIIINEKENIFSNWTDLLKYIFKTLIDNKNKFAFNFKINLLKFNL